MCVRGLSNCNASIRASRKSQHLNLIPLLNAADWVRHAAERKLDLIPAIAALTYSHMLNPKDRTAYLVVMADSYPNYHTIISRSLYLLLLSFSGLLLVWHLLYLTIGQPLMYPLQISPWHATSVPGRYLFVWCICSPLGFISPIHIRVGAQFLSYIFSKSDCCRIDL